MKRWIILFLIMIILFPMIYFLFLRLPHITYTESTANDIVTLQAIGKINPQVTDYLPKKGRNYYVKHSKSLCSILAKFNISKEDLEEELKQYNIALLIKPSLKERFIPFLMDIDYTLKKEQFYFYLGKDNIWHNTQLEILYFPKKSICYIYSLGNY